MRNYPLELGVSRENNDENMAFNVAGIDCARCLGRDGGNARRFGRQYALHQCEDEAKACKAMNLDPINTARLTRLHHQRQQKPANLPSVDNETPHHNDAGHRRILGKELSQERQLETIKSLLNRKTSRHRQ